jgi:hypothetical protein
LLTDSDLTIEKVAKVAGVTVEFVKAVQHKISSGE